ncbi:Negative regulator of sexual conjugation and meiosis [Rhodotorula toruloides]|nr:Negative regulator of sexual conjugation and meiosis [Rhodotorula toruloides]
MSFFDFVSPLTMHHLTTASSSSASTSTSSASTASSPSTSSQSSYTSTESHLQPPFSSAPVDSPTTSAFFDSRSPSPPPTFESFAAPPPPAAAHARPPAPISPPPPTSFAQAQAAMAANNSTHSQNLIGHVLDNSSPDRVSHLEFVSILGLGAYGVVYLARDIAAQPTPYPTSRAHPQLGNLPLYAVKCLNKVGLDERQLSFQRREIGLHSVAAKHPNVVTMHNVIIEETCIYVVLQFCEDGDLFGMITERQRYLGDDDLIRKVFLQIVDAVEFCHSAGIYHRDLKPENILCLEDGRRVVLADFGLATHERTSGDFGCGSTFYMSPECQGGLFQRLASYSTAHNDIWSLGVILVNLTCGRNPWKQACPSDETFCAYLGNPDFLRSILPISEHTNRILKRIFALNPQARISLAELRREIASVRTFTMSDDELRNATRATKEAARAFAQSGKAARENHQPVEQVVVPPPQPQLQYDEEEVEDVMYEDEFQDAMQFEEEVVVDVREQQPRTPWTKAFVPSSPTTPTQPHRRTPLTPPATPRRSAREAPTPIVPPPPPPVSSRRKRPEAPSTPPPQSRASFESNPDWIRDGDELFQTPPSPVTPTQRRRSPRSAARQLPNSRRRKTSVDSSSSSSGNSSLPATPTGPSYPPHVTNQYGLSPNNKVRIAGSADAAAGPVMANCDSTSSTLSAGTKAAYTAYYPIWSDDWADACRNQQASYRVELPPPVVLPADMDDHDEATQGPYQFPTPPTTGGYYTRIDPDEHMVH